MKTPALTALLLAAVCMPAFADKAADLIAKGRAAEKDGNVAVARAAYTEALKIQPANPHARYALDQLAVNQGSIAAIARQKKLQSVVIPQIDFDEVEFSEALAALSVFVEKETKKEYTPNFMVQDPSKQLADRKITLKLKSVPAKVVLDMMLEQTSAKARYDEHAVVVQPRG